MKETDGQRLLEAIIKGGLFHAQCAHDESHGCVIVWSSGAAEQLEAMLQRITAAPKTEP